MKKTSQEKLKLGIFVITGLLLFVIAIYFIGNRKNMFTKTFTINAHFNNVNGLLQGNNVRYSGINVGTVKTISMINDSVINVSMIIDEEMIFHIKKNAIATIGSDGLVGNMIVNIIPKKGAITPISPGDTIQTYTRIATNDMLNTLNVTNENAALLTADLLKITTAINQGKGTLGILINDTIVSENFKQILYNLKTASNEANKSLRNIEKLISTINLDKNIAGILLNDTIEAKKIKRILSNFETSSNDIKTLTANANKTLLNLKDGNGAINYLSNDKELVKTLEKTIKNLNEGTYKFNQVMEALKHNFLTRGYFKKLEREEKKSTKKINNN